MARFSCSTVLLDWVTSTSHRIELLNRRESRALIGCHERAGSHGRFADAAGDGRRHARVSEIDASRFQRGSSGCNFGIRL